MRWEDYTIDGATRPDAISGLDPRMREALSRFLQDAPPGLQIYSAYRSNELQGQLYQNALSKYGSEAEARKWVAPPGRSLHNSGLAVDMKYNGVRLDQAPQWVQDWVKQKSPEYGLVVPMEWEPWQVELAGARDQPMQPAQPAEPQRPEQVNPMERNNLWTMAQAGQQPEGPPPFRLEEPDPYTFRLSRRRFI